MPASYDINSAALYQRNEDGSYTLIEGDVSGQQGSAIDQSPTDISTTVATQGGGAQDNEFFEQGENVASDGGLAGVYEGYFTEDGVDYLVVTNTAGANTVYVMSSAAASGAQYPTDFDDDGIDTDPLIECFAPGTLIATPDGEKPVEEIARGELVRTAAGHAVPVKWIGRQTLHKVFTPAERFRPVRIRANALGENVPSRDLMVTGDHGIMVGDVMVNAAALVNGSSIVRVPQDELPDRLTYYHVETENHEVIYANGTPAETILDAVTRRGFDNYAEYRALFGESPATMGMLPYPRALSHRQLPEQVRRTLAERAGLADDRSVAA